MCSSLRRRSVNDAEEEACLVDSINVSALSALPTSALGNDGLDVSSCASPPANDLRIIKTNSTKRVRGKDGYRQRAAALCVRRVSDGGELEILLVSGRGAKNYWVLPGGGLEHEESAEEAVIREFREEAGIQGAVVARIGEFTDEERYHRTTLFLISVMEVFDEWEDYQTGRERRWMSAKETFQKIKRSQAVMVEQSLTKVVDILNKK